MQMSTLRSATLACVATKGVPHSLRQSLTRIRPTLVGSFPTAAAGEITEITENNLYEAIDQSLTPLLKMPYNDQLKLKQTRIESMVASLHEELDVCCRNDEKPTPHFKPVIHQICPSPVTEGYRNFNRFEVCSGIDGNPKTVGFPVICPRTKKPISALPNNLCYSRLSHLKVAKAYEDFIRSSPLPSSWKMNDGGFWRDLVVRSNDLGQVMALIMINSRNATKDMIAEQQELLRQYFVQGPGADCRLHSLYSQACPHSLCVSSQAPFILLHGEEYLEEKLHGRMFYIPPSSFFENNAKMEEILCRKILSVAKLSKQTTLFDLFCGTGNVSILAYPHVRGTIGIDPRKDLINNAIYNAAQNQIHGAYFTAGRVDYVLAKILPTLGGSPDMVAVVNSGSEGAGKKLIQLLQDSLQIRKVIYVARKLDHPLVRKDVLQFIIPQKTIPFKISQVIPGDTAPHTIASKVILSLDR